MDLTDCENRTALEILSEHQSQISLETGRIILGKLGGLVAMVRGILFTERIYVSFLYLVKDASDIVTGLSRHI